MLFTDGILNDIFIFCFIMLVQVKTAGIIIIIRSRLSRALSQITGRGESAALGHFSVFIFFGNQTIKNQK